MIELKKENKQATHKPRFVYDSYEGGKKVRIIQTVDSEQQQHTKKKHTVNTPARKKNAWPLV